MFSLLNLSFLLCSHDLDAPCSQRIMGFFILAFILALAALPRIHVESMSI